ncbi:tetratricopeptide repeat protein [Paraburkholderia sp. J10-1]|uniref:tetratricopeptide repeat protein n=1 Tax=Paraburkholderia sp. J10-1 TaxID=2805430 RepID=UPI002AB60A0F|nr:tetratricopeptide repeat protein [Paraburkholderia sp. J10-1]
MTTMSTLPPDQESPGDSRLQRLLKYLEADPVNLKLLEDIASHAFEVGEYPLCAQILERYEALAPLPPALTNRLGLVALSLGDYGTALDHFRTLAAEFPEPEVRYNVAYAHAMLAHYGEALAVLDPDDPQQLPAAATLTVRVLHHLGRLDEAMQVGQRWLQATHPDPELAGALATACFDANDVDAARQFANMSPASPDSLTVRGLLALEAGSDGEAYELLEHAIRLRPASGRAKLGLGLYHLSRRQLDAAAVLLDEAAQTMASHAGAWVAAGWAHLLRGDLGSASTNFTQAWEMDRGFAEAPGGLAVTRVHQQRADEARRLADTALRLDRHCLSGALALSLLAAASGDNVRSATLIDTALESPIDPRGLTLRRLLQMRAAHIAQEGGGPEKG